MSKTVPATEAAAVQALYDAAPTWARTMHRYRIGFMVVCALILVSADQVTKLWARDTLAAPLPQGVGMFADDDGQHYRPVRDIRVIDGIWHFQYAENPAAAFSLTQQIPRRYRLPLLLGVVYLAIILISAWMWRMKEPDWLMILALSLIFCGAIGNLIDRHAYGYVIDFISWRLTRWWPTVPPWPTFNIADSCIVGGAIGILIRAVFPFGGKQLKEIEATARAKA